MPPTGRRPTDPAPFHNTMTTPRRNSMLTARFFQVYDGFRSDIVHAYSANACFSFMALRSAPAYVQPSTVGSPLSTVAAAQFTRGWSPRVFVQAGPARSANGRLHSQQSQSVGGQGQHARVWYVAGMPRTTLPSSATLVVVRMFSYAPPPPHPFCLYTLHVQLATQTAACSCCATARPRSSSFLARCHRPSIWWRAAASTRGSSRRRPRPCCSSLCTATLSSVRDAPTGTPR